MSNEPVLECINPATRELICTLPISSEEEIQEKLSTIKRGLESWRAVRLIDRARLITRVRKHLVSRMDELVRLIGQETGKTEFDSIIEIMTAAEIMRFVAKKGPFALSSEKRSTGFLMSKRGSVHYRPFGTVGVISPWNYPLILTAGPVVQALMAGNGVILKPSEYAPLTALKMKEIFDEAGLPADILQVAVGGGQVAQRVVASSATKMICFIGSVEVGRKIAMACAGQLKPLILELGGKDPMIVLEDADLERAARAAIWGGFHNAGQTCISVERIYVEESVADQFIARVTQLAHEVRFAPGVDDPDMGSIINERQWNFLKAQILEAKEKGAEILVGDDQDADTVGYFIRPTVIATASQAMDVMTREMFGPIIAIMKVKDQDEAVEMANSIDYGLNASIFTSSSRKASQIARRIHAGNVCINDVLANYLCAELPFGGVGTSGIGRLQGVEGIRGFAQIQSVCEDWLGLKKEPWWFHVPAGMKKAFRFLIKVRYG